ncbi:MAG: DUF4105 domain-containing protein [Bacteroidales bacterium]|nr:DUF4105 domain-containing protein [Bacteroidales bacterium]
MSNFHKTVRLVLIFLLFCIGLSFPAASQTQLEKPLGKKATVSLLTASPGEEVYSQYGHTGIRVFDPDQHFDLVFNYGLFDFNSPGFILRFVKGQTDYMVGACSYMDFLLEYQMDNRAVTEQVLNLTSEEKETIWRALIENIQPENRTYRYNFFFNNCSTKPRDIIVRSISGRVDYRWNGKFKSLRDEVHFFTKAYPWTQFGIDFTLGAQADDSVNLKGQQFAPDLLMESFARAVILSDTAQMRPLVLETKYPATVDNTLEEKASWTPGPVITLWLVLLIVAAVSFLEFRNGKKYPVLDAVIFTVAGLVGFIITFLVLFSEHPTTDVNFLLLWLHPIHLIYAICLIIPVFRKKAANIYLSINLPFQIFALAGSLFLPQYLHPAMYPFLLCMILRSGMALCYIQKNRAHA